MLLDGLLGKMIKIAAGMQQGLEQRSSQNNKEGIFRLRESDRDQDSFHAYV
jgi:hypothetical protein